MKEEAGTIVEFVPLDRRGDVSMLFDAVLHQCFESKHFHILTLDLSVR